MTDIFAALGEIASAREGDPLAPVTVIVPSHASGLQLRRRLAELRPFAAVRFETLPRIAELIAAGHLAGAGRSPLARPIGDYLAERVALESSGALARVRDLRGYARVLRQIFRRLRRGGIQSAADVKAGPFSGHMAELLRLYDLFRQRTAQFYDEEDLLEAATDVVRSRRAGVMADLGDIYAVPPYGQTAGGARLLDALADVARCVRLEEASGQPARRFVLAPDPASEAREVVREVIAALESGVALHEIAVFHGADDAYPRLLREAFAAADVPAVPLPGIPLSETRAGRGVLGLAMLPERDFSRVAAMDILSVGPLREWLPGRGAGVRTNTALWDKLSREAGVTRDETTWRERLLALIGDRRAAAEDHLRDESESRAQAAQYEADEAERLLEVIETLFGRLKRLCEPQRAQQFIDAFKGVVKDYLEADAQAVEDVMREIDQLGTVDAVGGSFSLGSFAQALGANLDVACVRPNTLGNGVVIADYRAAAGMRFQHVVLCGAYEGCFPAGPGTDALVDDRVWRELRRHHPLVEDAELRIERAEAAADRAIAAAGDGTVVWSFPRFEAGGTREYYPSHFMVREASASAGATLSGSQLRDHASVNSWLRSAASPLGALLRGGLADAGELLIRRAVALRKAQKQIGPEHARWRAVTMLRSRRSDAFTEWDGNLSALADDAWLELQRAVSPTSLENYAACGFRYFCGSLLRLRAVEEPEERQMMEPAARGSLIHHVLHRFFREQKERGRPAVNEAWGEEDFALLTRITEEELGNARERGLTGLEVYGAHEARMMEGDLALFLEQDTAFRRETGAVPSEFEYHIPEVEIAGVRLRGIVDRVDRTPDGARAWVIDYKTGSLQDFEDIKPDNPLAGGRKLQLPTYLSAAGEAAQAQALYWFISQRGGFKQIGYDPSPGKEALFEETLRAIVRGVRAGAFPAVPGEENEHYGGYENCRYCDFDRICSRRRDFEFAAKSTHAEVAPWKAVAVAAGGGDAG